MEVCHLYTETQEIVITEEPNHGSDSSDVRKSNQKAKATHINVVQSLDLKLKRETKELMKRANYVLSSRY